MADTGGAFNARHVRAPARTLRVQRLAATRRELVVAAAALPRLLHPATGNQPAVLETVEHRIQRSDVERHGALGTRLDAPSDLVTVARTLLELRENEQLRRALLQGRVFDRCVFHMCEIYISQSYCWQAGPTRHGLDSLAAVARRDRPVPVFAHGRFTSTPPLTAC